jgi:Holliday junction resolvasome RuvABC endonuclease subunit
MTNQSTILALDPGLRELGYAVLRGRRLMTQGVLDLRGSPVRRRPAEAANALTAWIRAYRPQTLVLEQIPNHRTGWLRPVYRLGKKLGRLGTRCGLPVATYSVKAVRKTVVGYGWATKRDVAEVLCGRYPILRVHLTQDRKWKERYWFNLYDAVALALHHQTLINPPSRSR